MKTILRMNGIKYFLCVVLVACCLTSCKVENNSSKKAQTIEGGAGFKIYQFDGCEYVGYMLSYSTGQLVHKGNCKFCLERQKVK